MGKKPTGTCKLNKDGKPDEDDEVKHFLQIKKTYSSTSPIMHSRSSTSALATAC